MIDQLSNITTFLLFIVFIVLTPAMIGNVTDLLRLQSPFHVVDYPNSEVAFYIADSHSF